MYHERILLEKFILMKMNEFASFLSSKLVKWHDSYGSISVHLESHKLWGDKISDTINMQRSLSFTKYNFLHFFFSKGDSISILFGGNKYDW